MPFVSTDGGKGRHHLARHRCLQAKKDGQFDNHVNLLAPARSTYQHPGSIGTQSPPARPEEKGPVTFQVRNTKDPG